MKDGSFVPKSICVYCGYAMDAATSAFGENQPPSPTDISVCVRCGETAVFGDDLRLRKPTAEEILAWGPDVREKLRRISAAIRRLHEGEQR